MARKDRGKGGDDEALWRAVTRDVTPNPDRNKPKDETAKPKAKKKSAGGPKAEPQRAAARAAAGKTKPRIEIDAEAPPRLDTIARRTARRLTKGSIAIDDRIDLHGMSRDDAHGALFRFIPRASAAGHRNVLVVTGKGKGVLQQAVPLWLTSGRLAEYVVSIAPAPQALGGTGALYVVLRKVRAR